MQESLRVMGVGAWLQWLAWFIKHLALLLLVIAVETVLWAVGGDRPVLAHTDPGVFFAFLLSYAVATILFCYLLSTLFSRSRH